MQTYLFVGGPLHGRTVDVDSATLPAATFPDSLRAEYLSHVFVLSHSERLYAFVHSTLKPIDALMEFYRMRRNKARRKGG